MTATWDDPIVTWGDPNVTWDGEQAGDMRARTVNVRQRAPLVATVERSFYARVEPGDTDRTSPGP